MGRIVFLDTETTGVHRDRHIWDVAAIVRDPGQPDVEHSWIVTDVDLRDADEFALRLGHFYDRHPRYGGDPALPGVQVQELEEIETTDELERLTRHATIIGAVPHFDTSTAAELLYSYGMKWAGHYHTVDVENVILGYLHGTGDTDALADGPPYNSNTLSQAIGVTPPDDALRHTALGDARWVRDMWDTITAGTQTRGQGVAA